MTTTKNNFGWLFFSGRRQIAHPIVRTTLSDRLVLTPLVINNRLFLVSFHFVFLLLIAKKQHSYLSCFFFIRSISHHLFMHSITVNDSAISQLISLVEMDTTKDYSSYTLPHRSGPKYASPALIPLVADSIISTSKSRPTSAEPPGYSALSDLASLSPKLKVIFWCNVVFKSMCFQFRYAFQTLGLACVAAAFFTYVS